jgi:hypothetical protein
MPFVMAHVPAARRFRRFRSVIPAGWGIYTWLYMGFGVFLSKAPGSEESKRLPRLLMRVDELEKGQPTNL